MLGAYKIWEVHNHSCEKSFRWKLKHYLLTHIVRHTNILVFYFRAQTYSGHGYSRIPHGYLVVAVLVKRTRRKWQTTVGTPAIASLPRAYILYCTSCNLHTHTHDWFETQSTRIQSYLAHMLWAYKIWEVHDRSCEKSCWSPIWFNFRAQTYSGRRYNNMPRISTSNVN